MSSFSNKYSFLLFSICLVSTKLIAQQIPDSLLQNANAVVLTKSQIVVHDKFNKYNEHIKSKIKVLNKKAEEFQHITLYYKDNSEKITDVEITVYDSAGNVIKKAKQKDLADFASEDGYSMITDYRLKHWKYDTNTYPITIEFEYKKISTNTLGLPSWNPIPNYNVAILHSSYELISNLSVRKKEIRTQEFPSITVSNYNFVMNNQRAIRKEKYTPPKTISVPKILINPENFEFEGYKGSFKSWEEYGSWIYSSFLEKKKIPKLEVLKKELDKYIFATDNVKNKSKKIYEYLQHNTRYISLSLEEGGLNPMDPVKVHQVKYSDCKGLSFYMKTLLNVYNISSNYIEVAADSEAPVDLFQNYPSGYPGNHIILNIPTESDTFWVDCTSHDNPFNFLGSFTDNRLALEINGKGGKLVKTPMYHKSENKTASNSIFTIDSEGGTTAEISTLYTGLNIEPQLRLSKLSTEEKIVFIKEKKHKKK